METKDQINQNPVEENMTHQEENSKPKTSDLKPEENVVKSTEEKETKLEESATTEEKKTPEAEKTADPEDIAPKPVEEIKEEPAVFDSTESKKQDEEVAPIEKQEIIEEPKAEQVNQETEKTEKPAEPEDSAPEPAEEIKVEPAAVDSTESENQEEEIAPIEKQEIIEEPKAEQVKEETEKTEKALETETQVVEPVIAKPDAKESKELTDPIAGDSAKEEEHDEEDHDTQEFEHEEQVDYEALSLEELIASLEEILQDGEVEKIKKKVAIIKGSFLKRNKERQEKRFETFIAEGGEKEDYNQEKDELEVRFQAAFQIYHEKRKHYLGEQEKIKQQNLEGKKLVLVELKALIESEESLKHTYDEFKNLQEKWKTIGMVPKAEVNNLWQNYHFYVEKFFDKVKINKELRDLDLKKNMEAKIELCEKAEELLLETSVLKSFKQLQQYHHEWKEIGPIPQDKKDEIWERFKSTTDKINDLRREHYNSLRDEQKKNLEAKVALCEKSEEILQIENTSIKDWQTNTDQISELLKIWKTIGQAPRQQNDEIWERFKTSLDTFFAGKKEYFQQVKDEQMNNYNLKLDLCTQAEAIKGSTDWKNTTKELINLQKDWKNIGPVPKRHSDKIWKKFRAACDEFFNSKSDYFGNIKQHEADNLKLKEELITKVEGFDFGSDKNENLDVLKGFQREFIEIGHVPFKEKDRLQISFRDTINKQFDKLKISRAEVQAVNYKQRFENLKDNPNANRIVYNERNFLAQKRKKLEDEINLLENNMGFFAQSKNADLLKLELVKKIEKARSEIILLNEKIKFLEREAE